MISRTRSWFLALLLIAAGALAASPAPAPAAAPAAAKKVVAPSCAPLPDAGQSGAAAGGGKTATTAKGRTAKSDDDDDDFDDDKDFPPLKPGESYHLIGFTIGGSKHIDEDALIAMLPEHVGDPITDAQVKADTDKIKKALTKLHVHYAEVTTGLVQRQGPDHCVWVVWDIQHIDAFSRLPYQGYWKFAGQTFSGNKALTDKQLEDAIDLKPGERVREGAISDAITGMQQAYDKVFPGKTVKITGKLKLTLKPVRLANFEWDIAEPAAK